MGKLIWGALPSWVEASPGPHYGEGRYGFPLLGDGGHGDSCREVLWPGHGQGDGRGGGHGEPLSVHGLHGDADNFGSGLGHGASAYGQPHDGFGFGMGAGGYGNGESDVEDIEA